MRVGEPPRRAQGRARPLRSLFRQLRFLGIVDWFISRPFGRSISRYPRAACRFEVVFEYLMITVLLLNTFFLLVTTQVQSNGRRVMTHKEIRSHYCKNELLIDLVSTVSERSPSVRSPVGARWSYFGS